MKKKKQLSIFEIIWYSISGAIGLWGLVYIVLGIVANNLAIPSKNNELLKASEAIKNAFGLDFFGWGLILLALGTILAVIVLLIKAKDSDREYEKSIRRAARLNRNKEIENKVVEAQVEE